MLDLKTLTLLSDLLDAVQRNSPITWTEDEGETIRTGTVRRFCSETGGYVECDVREAYVEVTTSLFNLRLPVTSVIGWAAAGAAVYRKVV